MPKKKTATRTPRWRARESTLLELKKESKRRRIIAACFELFSKHGFEGTTLRRIAQYAGVALGTLSLYARDKRDLVLLLLLRGQPILRKPIWVLEQRLGQVLRRMRCRDKD